MRSHFQFTVKKISLIVAGLCAGSVAVSEALQHVIAYDRYGVFENIGGPSYAYRVVDPEGLRHMVLPGIYPNVDRAKKGPKISAQELYRMSKVWTLPAFEAVSFWEHFDPRRARDPRFTEGVRQFYYARSLEHAGRLKEAILAYYAVVVHFPTEQNPNRSWPAYWPAYLGVEAMDAIYHITSSNPELGVRYVGGDISIENGFNDTETDDLIRVWPGHLTAVDPGNVLPPSAPLNQKFVYVQGSAESVGLVRFSNGHWQLRVNGKPFVVRGVQYLPPMSDPRATTVQARKEWDAPGARENVWKAWLDSDRNGARDEGEPALGDFALMALMGVNTVRMDQRWAAADMLERAHGRHGLRFILGDSLGSFGLEWPVQDRSRRYSDPQERAKIASDVERMVQTHKAKPYVLAWYLGDGMPAEAIRATPAAYFDFIEGLARRIHELDPGHPVMLVLNDLTFVDLAARLAPSVDVIGTNSNRGFHGFGRSFWKNMRDASGKPILVTAYGPPAYAGGMEAASAEEFQARYHKAAWRDIEDNLAGGIGQGNALGGIAFEWLDGWKRGPSLPGVDASLQETLAESAGPFIDGSYYSEWQGLMALGPGKNGVLARRPRKAYWEYIKLWKVKPDAEDSE